MSATQLPSEVAGFIDGLNDAVILEPQTLGDIEANAAIGDIVASVLRGDSVPTAEEAFQTQYGLNEAFARDYAGILRSIGRFEMEGRATLDNLDSWHMRGLVDGATTWLKNRGYIDINGNGIITSTQRVKEIRL